MKEKNPYNNVGISFASEVEILEKGKERMRQLGIRSFSEYVKQLIKYDLGLPNYISQYISKNNGDYLPDDEIESVERAKAEAKRKTKKHA